MNGSCADRLSLLPACELKQNLHRAHFSDVKLILFELWLNSASFMWSNLYLPLISMSMIVKQFRLMMMNCILELIRSSRSQFGSVTVPIHGPNFHTKLQLQLIHWKVCWVAIKISVCGAPPALCSNRSMGVQQNFFNSWQLTLMLQVSTLNALKNAKNHTESAWMYIFFYSFSESSSILKHIRQHVQTWVNK